jgi:hypothetical protein
MRCAIKAYATRYDVLMQGPFDFLIQWGSVQEFHGTRRIWDWSWSLEVMVIVLGLYIGYAEGTGVWASDVITRSKVGHSRKY